MSNFIQNKNSKLLFQNFVIARTSIIHFFEMYCIYSSRTSYTAMSTVCMIDDSNPLLKMLNNKTTNLLPIIG